MEALGPGEGAAPGNGPPDGEWEGDPADRDRLIAAIYEAAIDPAAYGPFVAALSAYLERTAVKSWQISDLSEVDICSIEADRGLALHFANLNQKLATARLRNLPGSLRERISHRPGLAILLDPSGRVDSLSPAARGLAGDAVPVMEQIAGRLHADDAGLLRDAMVEHAIHGRPVSPRILRGDAFHLFVRSLRCDVDAQDFLCLETLSVHWSPDLERVLEASFRLTPAELRVVRELASGETAKAMSLRFGRSEGTVRNQIKAVLAKTAAGGLANLNRIVALIAENIAGAPALDLRRHGSHDQLDILTLPDGRALEVRLQGPRDGRPVLFIHGMLFGSELPGAALDCLATHGLRLIAPSRPNFGLSDPAPGSPEDEADRLVEDLVFVLDRYGVDRTVCLTNIAGTVYGYAFAAAAPDRVTGLVHAGSTIPLLKARQFAAMPPTQRLIAFLMRFVPAFLPPLLQSGVAQIRASGEAPFLATLYREGTCDHAVATNPDLVDLMARSVHFGTDQGYLAAYTDTFHVVRDWSDLARRVSALGIPSIHVQGLSDPQYMVDDVAAFVGRFDTLELRRIEGTGQLVLFDRPEPVLEAVVDLMRPR